MSLTVNNRRDGKAMCGKGYGFLCIACEAVTDLIWRTKDDPCYPKHCPYCGADDSLVKLKQIEYTRHTQDEYEVEPVE